MLWILAFHIIFMVCWFAGIFYLPRLFVYHAQSTDEISLKRFVVMEKKLFYGIMTPTGVLTTIFGLILLVHNWSGYLQQKWLIVKLFFVAGVWVYHGYCGYLAKKFKDNKNQHSALFFRWFNEISILLLMIIVILAVVKPF